MRKVYGKRLVQQFAQMAIELTPSFEEFDGESQYVFPRYYPFVSKCDKHIWLFIVLYINPKGEQSFTVLFGWSCLGRFPEVLDSRFPLDILESEPKPERFLEKEYLQRVGVFYGFDKWWYLEGDAKNWRGHLDGDKPEPSTEDADASVAAVIAEVKALLERRLVAHLMQFVSHAPKKGHTT